jgi:hypothetical protein
MSFSYTPYNHAIQVVPKAEIFQESKVSPGKLHHGEPLKSKTNYIFPRYHAGTVTEQKFLFQKRR